MTALRKLLLGETWLLPLGLAAVLIACALLRRPLGAATGFVLLAGVLAVLIAAVQRSSRPRR